MGVFIHISRPQENLLGQELTVQVLDAPSSTTTLQSETAEGS